MEQKPRDPPLKLAFLGTGLMGAPMARHLLAAGHALTVWNRSPDKAQTLAEHGATVCASAAEAADGADRVFTMLSDGSAVFEVLFRQGVAEAMAAGSLAIDCSSIKPAEAKRHAAQLRHHGVRQVDAPVSGGTRGAEAGNLAVMVGGEEDDFIDAAGLIDCFGRPTRVGPSGAGQLAKLANQAIVAITIGAVAEATLLVQRSGADAGAFRRALRGGFADSAILQQHGERMAARDFAPGGPAKLQLKDLDNVLEAARDAGIALPQSAMAQQRYARLVNELGGAELDHAALYLELLERNGEASP